MDYVKGVTSDIDLNALRKRLNVTVDGILLLEEFTNLKNKRTYIIILLGQSSGGHWVVYDIGYYFDSYGLPPFKEIEAMNFTAKQYQDVYGQFCCPYCLMCLYYKQKNKMHLLKPFVDLDIDVV